ncbi:hypothetical protein ACA910_016049 [Epithemia clementina (nom. ined.)]
MPIPETETKLEKCHYGASTVVQQAQGGILSSSTPRAAVKENAVQKKDHEISPEQEPKKQAATTTTFILPAMATLSGDSRQGCRSIAATGAATASSDVSCEPATVTSSSSSASISSNVETKRTKKRTKKKRHKVLAWYRNGQARCKLTPISSTIKYKSKIDPKKTSQTLSSDSDSCSAKIPKCVINHHVETRAPPKLLRSHEPYAQRLMDQLETSLSSVPTGHQNRDSSARKTFNFEWSFVVGQTTNALRAKHFETPHNFLPNQGVYTVPVSERQGMPEWKKSLWCLASRLLEFIDPDFAKDEHYVVSFSCIKDKSQYVRRHRDTKDISFQYALGLGDYHGAFLRVYTSNHTYGDDGGRGPRLLPHLDLDYKRIICKMDGRLPHELILDRNTFTGTRYSIIWFKLYDRRKDCCDPIFYHPHYV